MSEVLVYASSPERVLHAIALLESEGIACRIAQGSHVPWVTLSLPLHQVWVPQALAARAREVLLPLGFGEAGSAGRAARAVRWPLFVLASSAAGFVLCMIAFVNGSARSQLGAFAFLIVFVWSFRRLRRRPAALDGRHG